MAETKMKLIIRTPRGVVLKVDAPSLRVPTETGQVGIRPNAEPMVLAVEPGLALIRARSTYQFAGTAGGLLRSDGSTATLLTPLAVFGTSEDKVLESLDTALQQPNVELEVRATLSRLQSSILHELREGGTTPSRTIGDA